MGFLFDDSFEPVFLLFTKLSLGNWHKVKSMRHSVRKANTSEETFFHKDVGPHSLQQFQNCNWHKVIHFIESLFIEECSTIQS